MLVRTRTNELVTDLVNIDRVRSLLRTITQRRRFLATMEERRRGSAGGKHARAPLRIADRAAQPPCPRSLWTIRRRRRRLRPRTSRWRIGTRSTWALSGTTRARRRSIAGTRARRCRAARAYRGISASAAQATSVLCRAIWVCGIRACSLPAVAQCVDGLLTRTGYRRRESSPFRDTIYGEDPQDVLATMQNSSWGGAWQLQCNNVSHDWHVRFSCDAGGGRRVQRRRGTI